MTRNEFAKMELGLEKLFGTLPAKPDDLAALLWHQGYSKRDIKSFVRHRIRSQIANPSQPGGTS